MPRELREQSKYRVERLLGRGGMGSVFAAYHERMDRPVAIKVINSALVDHPEALNRFDQEVKAAAKLDHPNVARAYDADEFGSLRVLVMEYVPGQSLDRLLNARGRLTVVEACRLMRQAMIGLDHAHARGMVHRDLKPQNMMLTPTGKLKILDFGLAKIASEQRAGAGLTRDNALMGTPHYLAPEQALDAARADIRADIYSLGCTLYCLLSGSPPFNGDTEMKVLLAHQNDTPRPLCEVNREVPRELSDLVDRMLAKNPDDRPQTPKEVAEALLPFAKGEFTPPAEQPADPFAFAETESATRRATTAVAPSGRWRWSGVAAVVLLTLLFGGWALGVFTLRTPPGTIIVVDLPADVDVQVDGTAVTLSRDGNSMRITAVAQGTHHLKFLRDGHQVWASDAKVDVGDEQVRVTYAGNTSKPAQEFPAVQQIGGNWTTDGTELVQSPVSMMEPAIVFGDPNWSRYNVTFKACVTEGNNCFAIRFHVASPITFRKFQLGAFKGTTHLVRSIHFGQFGEQDRESRQGTIERDRWYDVRLEVRGAKCSCFLDGELLFKHTDESLTHGQIALSSPKSAARFRDILVTSEDEKTVLWQGPPKPPDE